MRPVPSQPKRLSSQRSISSVHEPAKTLIRDHSLFLFLKCLFVVGFEFSTLYIADLSSIESSHSKYLTKPSKIWLTSGLPFRNLQFRKILPKQQIVNERRSHILLCPQLKMAPPLTLIACPVISDESSDAKNATVFPISSGV